MRDNLFEKGCAHLPDGDVDSIDLRRMIAVDRGESRYYELLEMRARRIQP
jgi:hypothetical protein